MRIHPGQPLSGSQSGRARRRRLETGRSCNRSLWSMSTDFLSWVASIAYFPLFGEALPRVRFLLKRSSRISRYGEHALRVPPLIRLCLRRECKECHFTTTVA